MSLSILSSRIFTRIHGFRHVSLRNGYAAYSRAYTSRKRFTEDHEWVEIHGNIGTVGITDYAQKALGDVVYVELPKVGTVIEKADVIGAVESVKAASDIYAPASGKITKVNESLSENPGLINKSPENEAWLCKINLSTPKELDELMDANAYDAYCAKG
ncbi:5411_t:CDS:2 [Paraglomus occultum]|uniref:Glycine cleavage system H protein n=1 Tax=Paraglomus occultum TaxID=144539 RepID=A0A9N8W3L2_9GLOM|nr:5411_t:CDS:2 [Paraglomus occultum]